MGTYQEPVKSLIFIASASFSFSYLVKTKGLQYSTWNCIFMEKDNFDECFDKNRKGYFGGSCFAFVQWIFIILNTGFFV